MDGKYKINLKLSVKDVQTIIDWYEYCEDNGVNDDFDDKLIQVYRDLLEDTGEANDQRIGVEMTDSEKIAKIREFVEKNFNPDFDYDVEHWDNGNYDDSFQYGHDSGFNGTLETIKSIIDDE